MKTDQFRPKAFFDKISEMEYQFVRLRSLLVLQFLQVADIDVLYLQETKTIT